MISPDDYQARAAELTHAVRNLPLAQAHMDATLEPVRQQDLQLADRLKQTMTNRLLFLYSKMPKNPGLGSQLEGDERYQPSQSELSTWGKFIRAASNPEHLLEEMHRGVITPETVEATQTVFPDFFEDVRRRVIKSLGSPETAKLPYAKRMQLQTFFGNAVDSIGKPESIAFFQQAFASQEAEQNAKMGGKVGRPQQQPTTAQRISERNGNG